MNFKVPSRSPGRNIVQGDERLIVGNGLKLKVPVGNVIGLKIDFGVHPQATLAAPSGVIFKIGLLLATQGEYQG